MDERRTGKDRKRRRAGGRVSPARRHASKASDHLGGPRWRRPVCRFRQGSPVARFRGTQERHEGRIRAGGVEKDVTFVNADHAIDDKVDAAYRAKYRRYAGSILNSVLTPEARSTTIKLVPRS